MKIQLNCSATAGLLGALGVLLAGCTVGPDYHRPQTPAVTSYKEVPQQGAGSGWKVAQPSDSALRGNWWELFGDPQLNALEEQVEVSNQNIAAAFAGFMQARAVVRQAQAQYFPTLTVGAGVTRSRTLLGSAASGTSTRSAGSGASFATLNDFSLPFDASWTPDLWGKVRNLVKGDIAAAQASAADLANIRLSAQAELAVDYFELRSQDAQIDLYRATADAYNESLQYAKAQYETGIGTDEAVAQAEVQQRNAETQVTNLGIARAQYEHAIALLVGKPASVFSIAALPAFNIKVPEVPVSVPSQLLERRPDVAADERLVAQANAQIGYAEAAYFPTLTLSASAGFESSTLGDWLKWPSRVWSLGPQVSETIFDGGLRGATVAQYRAAEEQAAATYRQAALTAFQQVEDNLSGLRILMLEIRQQDDAVSSSQRYLSIATDRYKLGIDPYLNVMSAQTTLLGNQQSAIALRQQQLIDCVQLIEALGGGWDASWLPGKADVGAGRTAASLQPQVQQAKSQ